MAKGWGGYKSPQAWLPKKTLRDDDGNELPAGIKEWEINKGGWRYDGKDDRYFLKWEQLLEVERANATIADNDEYFEWFAKFRDEQGLRRDVYQSRGSSSATGGGTSYGGWTDDWEEDKEPGKKKWLSNWWAKDVYKSWGSTDASTGRLAVVLQAVRAVIRVIDDTVPPMSVEWASKETSYTDFTNRKIAINPKPVTANKLEDGEAIDVTTGFALHEASHSQYSRKPYKTMLEPTELSPMQIASLLLNIVEDTRIEQATIAVFPGFKGYIDACLKWVWDDGKGKWPKKWGPGLKEKMPAVIAICRWPVESASVLKDPSFVPEIAWWTAWRDDYLTGRVDSRTTVERGLEHLREDPETAKELDALSAAEAALKKAIDDMNKFIDEMSKMGIEAFGDGKVCSAEQDMEKLPETAARSVHDLVEEQLRIEKPTIPAPDGQAFPPIHVTHPLEDAQSRRAFVGKPGAMLQKLRAALVFRQELPRYHERLLNEGLVDDDELWRFGVKDYRLFHEEIITGRPKVQLTMLVDLSGSMTSGNKLSHAQQLAQLMVFATKDMEGVHNRVIGHTGDLHRAECQVFRIWEEGEPLSRLGLISSLPHSNNYDGYAIEWCVKEIINRGEPDEQRVVIVLSDGYPAGSNYGGAPAEQHMRAVGDWALHQGVTVIQIAIDNAVRPDRQAAMFRQWIQFEGMEKLPRQLTKLLARIV